MILIRTFINVNTDHRFMPYEDGDPVQVGPVLYLAEGQGRGIEGLLEDVYFIGNRMGPDASGANWPSNVRSLSVGDLVEIETLGFYAVDPVGFKYIHR